MGELGGVSGGFFFPLVVPDKVRSATQAGTLSARQDGGAGAYLHSTQGKQIRRRLKKEQAPRQLGFGQGNKLSAASYNTNSEWCKLGTRR